MIFPQLEPAARRQSQLLLLCYFSYFGVLAAVVPYLAVYLDAIGFTSREIGELIALITACRIFGPPLWATLADKTGRCLPYIRLGAAAALVLFLILLLSHSYWWVASTMGLLTLFWSAILPQMEVLALRTLDKHSELYSKVRVGGSVGFIAVVLVIGELLAYTGAERFPLYGAMLVAFLLVCVFFLYEPARHVERVKEAHAGNIWARLKQRQFIAFLLSTTMLQASFAPFYAFFALYLTSMGYAPWEVGAFIALGVLAEIGMFLIASRVVARYGVRNMLFLCMFLTALRWALLSQWAHVIGWLLLVQGLHAFSFALHHAAAIRFIHLHFPAAEHSRGQALYAGFGFGAGGALGAWGAGLVWESEGATMAFLMAAMLAFIGALLTLLMRADSSVKSDQQLLKG